MLKRYVLFLKRHPIITAIIAVAYAMVCIKSIPVNTYFRQFLLRTLLCGSMIFFLYQISGEKTLLSYSESTAYVIKVSISFWIFALLLGSFSFLLRLGMDTEIRKDAALQFAASFLMFVFVGLFEEMTFRAVINDAIIYRFRDKKFVFVLSAVCCSLVFGAAHVIGANLSTAMAWAQAAGKTLTAGIFGLALLLLYWKTRNIWACGVVHGIYDFLIAFSESILDIPSSIGTYVMPDEYAGQVLIGYAINGLIELVILFIIWMKVGRKIDYHYIREHW